MWDFGDTPPAVERPRPGYLLNDGLKPYLIFQVDEGTLVAIGANALEFQRQNKNPKNVYIRANSVVCG